MTMQNFLHYQSIKNYIYYNFLMIIMKHTIHLIQERKIKGGILMKAREMEEHGGRKKNH